MKDTKIKDIKNLSLSTLFSHIYYNLLLSQICVYKAKGDLKTAALELHKILKISYGDASLWQELANIHEILGDYKVRYHLLKNKYRYVYFFVYITFCWWYIKKKKSYRESKIK